jgi:hypothetical protein
MMALFSVLIKYCVVSECNIATTVSSLDKVLIDSGCAGAFIHNTDILDADFNSPNNSKHSVCVANTERLSASRGRELC